jgi:hypothetical protein
MPSCYIYMTSGQYARVTTRCAALGGSIVSYSNASEQLMVEKFFAVGASATAALALAVW